MELRLINVWEVKYRGGVMVERKRYTRRETVQEAVDREARDQSYSAIQKRKQHYIAKIRGTIRGMFPNGAVDERILTRTAERIQEISEEYYSDYFENHH